MTAYEDTGGAFYLDEELSRPDPVIDDQSLVIDTPEGVAVILGCCHAGIVNTLTYIAESRIIDSFLLVAGGMHLIIASEKRLDKTIEALDRFTIGSICPGHCTGDTAIRRLREAFSGRVETLSVGWRWTI